MKLINKRKMQTGLVILALFMMIVAITITILSQTATTPRTWIYGGGIISTDDFLNVSELNGSNSTKTNFYLSYVNTEMSENLLREVINKYFKGCDSAKNLADVNIFSSQLTDRDQKALGPYQVKKMVHNAIVSAFLYLKIEKNEDVYEPQVAYIPENFQTAKNLKVNDKILSVDGMKIMVSGDVSYVIEQKSLGDVVNVKVSRDGKVMDIPLKLQDLNEGGHTTIGAFLIDNYRFEGINDSDIIKMKEGMTGGSAGLMFTLAIIQKLDPGYDYSFGKKIAGTGGITRGGYIENIAELKLKIKAASENGAEVFLYPFNQKAEAEEASQKYKINGMKLIPVIDVKDAIQKIKQLRSEEG